MSLFNRIVEAKAETLVSVKVRDKTVKATRRGDTVVFSGPTGKHQIMDEPPGRWKAHWEGYLEAAKAKVLQKVPRLTRSKASDVVRRMADQESIGGDLALARAAVTRILKNASESDLDSWLNDAISNFWTSAKHELEDIQDQEGGKRRRGRLLKGIEALLARSNENALWQAAYTTDRWLRV